MAIRKIDKNKKSDRTTMYKRNAGQHLENKVCSKIKVYVFNKKQRGDLTRTTLMPTVVFNFTFCKNYK
jgi:hypothetical protein